MEPAQSIIAMFGGKPAIAAFLGIPTSTPYNWTLPKSSGGTGGVIPVKHHRALVAEARKRRLKLKPEDFWPLVAEAAHEA